MLPLWIVFKIFLYTLLSLSASVGLCRSVLRITPRAIRTVEWTQYTGWRVVNRRKETIRVQLLPGSFVTMHLAILNFKQEKHWRPFSVIIPWDQLPQASFRRLRVCLLTQTL